MLEFLMFCIGWQPLDANIITSIRSIKKSVIIYPHTSYWDFVVVLFYRYKYNISNIKIVVNAGVYNKYPLLQRLGCIPATPKEQHTGGFVGDTINKFKNVDNYNILISPEGTLKKVPWRSGYFYLAAGLNVPINVVGFDYVTHKIVWYDNSTLSNKDYALTEAQLKQQFGNIIPLYPKCSCVDIHHNSYPTIIDPCTLSTLILPLPAMYMTLFINFTSFLLLVIGYICSAVYHNSHEQRLQIVEPISIIMSFCYLMYILYMNHCQVFDLYAYIMLMISVCFYILAMGRHKNHAYNNIRTAHYVIFHSIFHCCISAYVTYLVWNVYRKL
jgi:hypothetical protein